MSGPSVLWHPFCAFCGIGGCCWLQSLRSAFSRTATTPAAGNWGYVRIATPNSLLEHCEFWYGGVRGRNSSCTWLDPYMLWVYGADTDVDVRNCRFERAFDVGLYYQGGTTQLAPDISGNTFSACPRGILLTGQQLGAVVSNNTITNCTIGIDVQDCATTAQIEFNTIQATSFAFNQNSSTPIYSGNALQGSTPNVISVGGTLPRSATWLNVPGLPYLVTSDVVIPSGLSLTIISRTTVKFQFQSSTSSKRRITANGQLLATGTSVIHPKRNSRPGCGVRLMAVDPSSM